jgi:hypothetical protein
MMTLSVRCPTPARPTKTGPANNRAQVRRAVREFRSALPLCIKAQGRTLNYTPADNVAHERIAYTTILASLSLGVTTGAWGNGAGEIELSAYDRQKMAPANFAGAIWEDTQHDGSALGKLLQRRRLNDIAR